MNKYIFILIFLLLVSCPLISRACTSEEALALAMYYEANGEGSNLKEKALAMQMVGEVVLNRVESNNYPNTVCGVVYQKHQFSWTDKSPRKPSGLEWFLAKLISNNLLSGSLPQLNNGSTHFLNPKLAGKPSWTRKLELVVIYKNHVFYSDNSLLMHRYNRPI